MEDNEVLFTDETDLEEGKRLEIRDGNVKSNCLKLVTKLQDLPDTQQEAFSHQPNLKIVPSLMDIDI